MVCLLTMLGCSFFSFYAEELFKSFLSYLSAYCFCCLMWCLHEPQPQIQNFFQSGGRGEGGVEGWGENFGEKILFFFYVLTMQQPNKCNTFSYLTGSFFFLSFSSFFPCLILNILKPNKKNLTVNLYNLVNYAGQWTPNVCSKFSDIKYLWISMHILLPKSFQQLYMFHLEVVQRTTMYFQEHHVLTMHGLYSPTPM